MKTLRIIYGDDKILKAVLYKLDRNKKTVSNYKVAIFRRNTKMSQWRILKSSLYRYKKEADRRMNYIKEKF